MNRRPRQSEKSQEAEICLSAHRDRDRDDDADGFARCDTVFQLTFALDLARRAFGAAATGQFWNANDETCVRQLNVPFRGMYSVV